MMRWLFCRVLHWHRYRGLRKGLNGSPHCTRCGLVKKPKGWRGRWTVFRIDPAADRWFMEPVYPRK